MTADRGRARVEQGFEDASFEDFVSREQAGLLRLAVLLAGDRGHAEDLVQTALLKTYRHWGRVTRGGDPTAYVRRVLVTTHTSWRRRLASTEQVVETLPDRADPARPREDDEELRAALRSLPPRMRAAVVLRYYADLSEQQAAEAMGCSASAVNTHTTRGLARLRALLAPPVLVSGEDS
ncbi:SigE family RNA polymerase sigma factor [Geodermatophilus sp. SYSU D00698]